MDPLSYDITEPTQWEGIGPHPSHMAVSRLYVLQPDIDAALDAIGMTESRDSQLRLEGANLIDALRKSMSLPVTVYNTACVLFARLRLDYPEKQYNLQDACTAAVFLACKMEDIFKKVKEIVAASHNFRNPAEKVYPDDGFLDAQNKRVLSLERLIIESTRMDFRTRHPHILAIKLTQQCGLPREVALKAYDLSMDLHRTWAPLKQNHGTMALACVELGARLCGADYRALYHTSDRDISELLESPRRLVIETMDELLDLYSFYRASTIVGPAYSDDGFLKIKLDINRERRELPDGHVDTEMTDAVRTIRGTAQVTSPTSPAPPRGTLSAVKDNTIRFVLSPQEMIEERLAQARYLPPDLRKADVPDWFVQWPDGRRTEVQTDDGGVPVLGPDGHPLDAHGEQIRVKNAQEARKKLEKQVRDGEFGRRAAQNG